MKTLKEYIIESAKNKYLALEITADEFETGDVVLFRNLLDRGDQDAVMVVVEPRGNRSLVADVGISLTLGSTHTFMNDDLFKVGHVEPHNKVIDYQDVYDICDELGVQLKNKKPGKLILK